MMRPTRYFLTLALAGIVQVGTILQAEAGEITGKVSFKGAVPPDPQIDIINDRIKKDPFCGKLDVPVQKSRLYVVDASGGLADVLVYIKEGLPKKPYDTPANPAVVDQVGCMYTPYITAVQAKQQLLVKNSDPLLHNVNVQPSPSGGNRPSNLAQAQGAKPLTYAFENPELFIRFACNVHPWMVAYVSVFDHPFFAVTDEAGAFKLSNVPPGEYVLEAVHRKTHPGGNGISQKIKVGSDPVKLDFTIELPAQ